ncbi:MAG: carboxypeptidase regulatory-like domain-containing protein, partial [Acidobacteriota bacterium]
MGTCDRSDAQRSTLCAWKLVLGVFLAAAPAHAQLGTACTAEVLNRTVRVEADGSFYFSNLPTEDGNFRVRITCTPDGSPVVHGQTPFFQLLANQTVEVGPVAFGAVSPIPAVLELHLDRMTMTQKGERLFLGTTGILGDGTELDFSPIEMGTEFWSSDPRLANIELIPVAPGRTVAYLHANERGRVLIAARVEGVLTAVEIDLELPNDADHDGITDEYEIAKGLNPNNPADALEDPDGDNLSNLREFELGTDPFNADTDADGLADDREIALGTLPANPDSDGDGFVDSQEIERGTNPLLADSDGDGLNDGLEIGIESDPLTPNPTTVVTGHVVDPEGVAVSGAAAIAYGRIVSTTDRSGAFVLGRVPADRGPIVVFARALRGGSALDGNSLPTQPAPGGTVDVGTIHIAPMNSRVSGRVLDAFGRTPVVGVRVVARSSFDVRQANTDPTGVFTFDRMVPGMIRLEATDPRTGLRGRADVSLLPDGEAVANIVLGSFGSIEGRALGRDAVTPAGPGVIVRRMVGKQVAESTVTGIDSTYRFAFVPLGVYTVETANGQGDRGRTTVVIQATSQTVVADIAFLGRGTVTGIVETETGSAVPGAPVHLEGDGIFEQTLDTTTGADGTFSFGGVFVGRFSASATNPSNGLAGSAQGEIRNEADHDAVTIVVRATGTLVGTVFDVDGTTPVAGASVSVGIRSTTTDASGAYRLDLLPLQFYGISAHHPTLPSCGVAAATLSEPNQTVRQDVVLRGTANLLVHVVYADGAPASAATIDVNGGSLCGVSLHATADGDGTFLFAPLPVGSFFIQAIGPIGQVQGSVGTELLSGEHGEVTIQLEPVGTIVGRVFQSNGTTPVSGMTVALIGTGRSLRSEADGSFRFDLVKVKGSPYTLQANDAQGVTLAQESNVVLHQQGEVVTRNLVLIPLAARGESPPNRRKALVK